MGKFRSGKERAYFNRYAKFLMVFTLQGISIVLPIFDFAAGEFPFPTKIPACLAPRYKEIPLVNGYTSNGMFNSRYPYRNKALGNKK
jgi:hypothetical protein